MNEVKWGILGTGNIAHTFAKALKNVPGAVTYAAASRNDEKAREFAKEEGFMKSVGSYELLAGMQDIDIIYVATPMSSHYDDTMMSLRKGNNVLCEKSAALNSYQLDDMITLAKETGLFFCEAMWIKCRPAYKKALEWAKSGKIGQIKAVKADFCNIVPVADNRLFNAKLGGGALLDLAVYPITLACDFLGLYPRDIDSNAVIGETGVDLTDTIKLTYANGSFADISASFQCNTKSTAAIIGTEGFISFGEGFVWSNTVKLYDKNAALSDTYSYLDNGFNGYEYEIIEAQNCLMNKQTESMIIPHSSTMAVMKIMDECRNQWNMTFPGE